MCLITSKGNIDAPRKPLSIFHRWAHLIRYLSNGAAHVTDGYVSVLQNLSLVFPSLAGVLMFQGLKRDGAAYAVRTQANYYVLVSSKKHMTELGEAPELSLRAAFGDVII